MARLTRIAIRDRLYSLLDTATRGRLALLDTVQLLWPLASVVQFLEYSDCNMTGPMQPIAAMTVLA